MRHLVVGLLVAAGMSGCSALSLGLTPAPTPHAGLGFADPAKVHSGLELTVMKGPISPVETIGSTNSLPVVGAVVSISTGGGQFIGDLTTGAGGFASASLDPGSYVASVSSSPGVMRLAAPVTVTVEANQTATLSLECDTGIR